MGQESLLRGIWESAPVLARVLAPGCVGAVSWGAGSASV